MHALDRLAQLLRGGVAELVIVPELVENLLFLHVGGKLLLLELGDEPLHIQKGAVLLLRLLVGAGALPFQLHAAIQHGGQGLLLSVDAHAHGGEAALRLLELGAKRGFAGLGLRDLLETRGAVLGELAEEAADLLEGAVDRIALGVERGVLGAEGGERLCQRGALGVKPLAPLGLRLLFGAHCFERGLGLFQRGAVIVDALLMLALLGADGFERLLLIGHGALRGLEQKLGLRFLALA